MAIAGESFQTDQTTSERIKSPDLATKKIKLFKIMPNPDGTFYLHQRTVITDAGSGCVNVPWSKHLSEGYFNERVRDLIVQIAGDRFTGKQPDSKVPDHAVADMRARFNVEDKPQASATLPDFSFGVDITKPPPPGCVYVNVAPAGSTVPTWAIMLAPPQVSPAPVPVDVSSFPSTVTVAADVSVPSTATPPPSATSGAVAPPHKRGPGRPKGAKNKAKAQ